MLTRTVFVAALVLGMGYPQMGSALSMCERVGAKPCPAALPVRPTPGAKPVRTKAASEKSATTKAPSAKLLKPGAPKTKPLAAKLLTAKASKSVKTPAALKALGATHAKTAKPRVLAALNEAVGEATYYARKFAWRPTTSGELLNQEAYTAAHRNYPFGTMLRVTNLKNARSILVRVTDRGPWGRLGNGTLPFLDLTERGARELGFMGWGHTRVKVEVLSFGGRKTASRE